MTSKLKTKKTRRKFYGKWLYKVSLRLKGAAVFRNRLLEDIELYCLTADEKYRHNPYSLVNKVKENQVKLLSLAKFLSKIDKDHWGKRIEQDALDFYTNDQTVYDLLSVKFSSDIKCRYEPAADSLELLDQPESIIVKKLPHDRYNYRVYLLPHKFKGDVADKKNYISWIKQQNGRITISPAVESWILTTNWNWDRRYVLVEDESTLLLLKLRNSEVCGRAYKFVIPINT
jgi:hypothetical protein